jgi:cation transport ATPase
MFCLSADPSPGEFVFASSALRSSAAGAAHIAMLAGDNARAAETVAHRLGIDRFYADLLLDAVGLDAMWEAVFADRGTALAAVANSTRMIGENEKSD